MPGLVAMDSSGTGGSAGGNMIKEIPARVPSGGYITLRVQVHDKHILTHNLYYNHNYPDPEYLIIGYMDPLGKGDPILRPQP